THQLYTLSLHDALPISNPAGDCDDAFAAQRRRLVESLFRRIRRVEDRLCPPFAVADVDEDESAEIAAGMDPAGQSDGLPDLRRRSEEHTSELQSLAYLV